MISVFLICACTCLAISAITAFALKKEKHIIINTIIRVALLSGVIYYTTVLSFFTVDNEYYNFTSPDGNHTVIAEEWSLLLDGGVNFYERENSFLVIRKENFNTDDGYRIISSGNYSVEWNENIMAFTGNNGNGVFKTVEIELNQ